MEGSHVNITFDDKYRVRVLESDKFDQTRSLEEACTTFTTSECASDSSV